MIMDSLIDGSWHDNRDEFRPIFDEIMYRNDEYFTLKDLNSYIEASLALDNKYADKEGWAKSCLVNIAKAGYFSSDRTIQQYVDDIWKLEKIVIED